MDTAARLLRLLSLLHSHPQWDGAELAARLEITPRTVRRDVTRLRSLGYPIDAEAGIGGGYRLGPGGRLPPLLLEDSEAVAIAVGLLVATTTTVTGVEEAAISALAKLDQVLPVRLREQVAAIGAHTTQLPQGELPPVDGDVLVTLAAGCRHIEGIRFRYRTHDGSEFERSVEPLQIVHTGRRWYLVAWDLDRTDWRTFRLDRLEPRIPTGPRFTPRDVPDLATTARGVASGGYRYQARILVHAPAEQVADRYGPNVATVTPVDDSTTLVETGANSLDQLALHFGLLGLPFEIQSPPELVETVRELTTRLTAAIPAP